MINVTSRTGRTGLRAARFATESSASFATIAAARPSVQAGASNVLSSAGRATAAGYGDLELHEYTSKRSEREFPALGPLLPSTRFVRNGAFVEADSVLGDGDELALLPPFGGG